MQARRSNRGGAHRVEEHTCFEHVILLTDTQPTAFLYVQQGKEWGCTEGF